MWQRVLGFRIRKSGFKEAQITLTEYQVHYSFSFPSPINSWIKEIISLIGSKLKFFTGGRWVSVIASLGYLHPRTGWSWLQDLSTSNISYQHSSYPVQGFWDRSQGHRWKSGPAGWNIVLFEGSEKWGQPLVVTIYLKAPQKLTSSFIVWKHQGWVRHCFVLGRCSEGPSAREHASVLGFGKTSCGGT